jgi:endonuclease/exonuclease/phosphatase family metal-dependent hydrolase
MRLATFNLLHGRSLGDGAVDLARLRAAVSTLDVDVLGIQEVDQAQPRSGGLDLTAEIACAMDAAAYRFAPAVIGTPGDSWRAATEADPATPPAGTAPNPAYGVGLISRWPVTAWRVLRLPASRLRSPVVVPGRRPRLVLLQDEPRVVLAAVIAAPIGPVTVATTHLSFVPGWNARQLQLATAGLRAMAGPRVLLGDLNLPAWAVAAVSPWRSLARIATYPAYAPKIQFDHILTDSFGGQNGLPQVVGVEAPALPLSDHRALVVTLASPDQRKSL